MAAAFFSGPDSEGAPAIMAYARRLRADVAQGDVEEFTEDLQQFFPSLG